MFPPRSMDLRQTMIDWSAVPSWAPSTVVAAVGWAVVFWRNTGISETQLNAKMDALKAELKRAEEEDGATSARFQRELNDLRLEMREALAEFRTATVTIARLGSSQEVVNAVTTKTIEGLSNKQEQLIHATNENAASIRILSELLSRIPLPNRGGN